MSETNTPINPDDETPITPDEGSAAREKARQRFLEVNKEKITPENDPIEAEKRLQIQRYLAEEGKKRMKMLTSRFMLNEEKKSEAQKEYARNELIYANSKEGMASTDELIGARVSMLLLEKLLRNESVSIPAFLVLASQNEVLKMLDKKELQTEYVVSMNIFDEMNLLTTIQ